MYDGFPIDLVLLALVAGFLVLRLRSVLGKRTGYERPPLPDQQAVGLRGPAAPVIDGFAEAARAKPGRPIPSPHTNVGQVLGRIAQSDRGFDPVKFVDSAEASFRRIVTAFAAGDLTTLRSLLTPTVYATFEHAITQRAEAGETQQTEIKQIVEASIDEAEMLGDHAVIVVRFVSDQENFTRDRAGQVIAGTEAVTEIVDLWSFERSVNGSDPIWRLAAARSG
ncbi:MAG: preprotein translocase subunit Tim44 [Acidiphilium sp. 37-64-53]|uniref:Tim44/TimA family putative adaptor protein n=1 Tax=Acidiphilium TaxID=522 RepID=UPI000BCF8752|nr:MULTISPECIES: Tim44/TimA family putative adaptor protein [Acidiphilium]OYW01913.1 MAG: preprotein translocase subunit Tim44 [Acidiphilium sp. 37-64-53]OZB29803.1 MAG: preprotein translocase subunit Tim44 [Acidiphilium sp. 34-64-41]HQT84453.1 Tim44/TimA family putative adaptor protein [Acidiphilium rubrum]